MSQHNDTRRHELHSQNAGHGFRGHVRYEILFGRPPDHNPMLFVRVNSAIPRIQSVNRPPSHQHVIQPPNQSIHIVTDENGPICNQARQSSALQTKVVTRMKATGGQPDKHANSSRREVRGPAHALRCATVEGLHP